MVLAEELDVESTARPSEGVIDVPVSVSVP